MSVFHKILRAGEGRTLKRLEQRVIDVNALEPEYEALSDDQLAAKTIEFRERFDQGEDLDELLNRLQPVAVSLGCADELARVADIGRHGASYQRQRRVAEEHDGDLRAVVDALIGELDI